ncbi:MAG TPA: hypothetical protein VH599_16490 [Ktedonobacterales bacterium]|jgi:hypothetical protein
MPCLSTLQPPGFFDVTFAHPYLLIGGLALSFLLFLGFEWLWRFWLARNLHYVPLLKEQPILYLLADLGGTLCLLGLLVVAVGIQWGNAINAWYAAAGQDTIDRCISVFFAHYKAGTPSDQSAVDQSIQAIVDRYNHIYMVQYQLIILALIASIGGSLLVYYGARKAKTLARSIETP